jgi:hypothetical protein
MLVWHRRLQLIDHGAALYFHHSWDGYLERSREPFGRIKDHVLLPFATLLAEVDAQMAEALAPQRLAAIVAAIPEAWLDCATPFADAQAQRLAYLEYLTRRLQAPRAFVTGAIDARDL